MYDSHCVHTATREHTQKLFRGYYNTTADKTPMMIYSHRPVLKFFNRVLLKFPCPERGTGMKFFARFSVLRKMSAPPT